MMMQEEKMTDDKPVLVVDGYQWDLGNLCCSRFVPDGNGNDGGGSATTTFRVSSNDDARSPDPAADEDDDDGDPYHPPSTDFPESLDLEDVFRKLNETRAREKARSRGTMRPSALGKKNSDADGRRSDRDRRGRSAHPRGGHAGCSRESSSASSEQQQQQQQQQHQQHQHQQQKQRPQQSSLRRGSGTRSSFGNKSSHQQQQPQQQPPKRPPPALERTMVEVMPGEFVPLRGSVETWEAVQGGTITKTACSCCGMDLVCVEDADLVMCPACRVISPVDGAGASGGGGLGLGMSVQDAKFELNRRGMTAERR